MRLTPTLTLPHLNYFLTIALNFWPYVAIKAFYTFFKTVH